MFVFALARLVPGDPVALMMSRAFISDPIKVAQYRHEYGLDQPIFVQYGIWLYKILQGDWGKSINGDQNVADLLKGKAAATVILSLAAVAFAVPAGIAFGMYSAVLSASGRHEILDKIFGLGPLVFLIVPQFTLGVLLIILFALKFPLFPPVGMQTLKGGGLLDLPMHLVLPALTLSAPSAAALARLTRAVVLEITREDYIRTAYAKGLSQRVVLYRHILRNTLIFLVTNIGIMFGNLLAGAVMVETVFAWPGLGKLMVDSVLGRDYPVIQGGTFLITLTYVLTNLVVDLSYTYIDPRVRYG